MKNFSSYIYDLNKAITSLKESELNHLFVQIDKRINSSNSIYLIGNGGSHANATHIAGDISKSFAIEGIKLKISNLINNDCYLTAASNDISFEDSYSILLDSIIEENDLIIYLSGSGNSINLVKSARLAKKIKGIYQISITAFNGGELSRIVDLPIHIEISDMEIAEDCQLIIFHYLKKKLLTKNVKSEENNMTKYKKRIMDDLVS